MPRSFDDCRPTTQDYAPLPSLVLTSALVAEACRVVGVSTGCATISTPRVPCDESERAAPVFVTGWRSRERLSAARRGEYRHGDRRSEDHPQRLARHPLQQAGAQPVQCAPGQGRHLDRGAGRGHRPPHAPAEPERPGRCWTRRARRPACSRCRPAAAASGRSNCW